VLYTSSPEPRSTATPRISNESSGPPSTDYDARTIPSRTRGDPDEVGTVGALLMSSEGAFITGSGFPMDGGVTASYFFGDLAPN